jgi:hypothetical protein
MKRNRKRIVAAVLAICALAAGGAAFTNSIDTSGTTGNTAGYGSVSVTGNNTLSSVSYDFNNNGSQITGVHLTFQTALTGQHVHVGFDNQATPSTGALTDCGPETGASVACTLDVPADTDTANNLNVLVADN